MQSTQRILPSAVITALAVAVLASILPLPAAAATPDNAHIRAQKTRAPERPLNRPSSYIQRTYRPQIAPSGRGSIRRGPACRNNSGQQQQQPVYGGNSGNNGYGGYNGYNAPYVVYIDPTPHEPRVVAEPQRTYQPPPVYEEQPRRAAAPAPEPRRAPAWQAPASIPAAPEPQEPRRPRSTEPQPVTISIQPADALVYLDDEPLGTAGSLSELNLRPGVYVLEVEHPELSGQRLVFGVGEESLSVAVDLRADRPSRRSRVK